MTDPHAHHVLAVSLLAAMLAATAGTARLLAERGPAFPTPAVPAAPSGARAAVAAPLDLNRADAEALTRLPGIGSVLAGRILAHRKSRGPFRRAEELLEVPGIGPGRWERLRPLVAAGGA